MNDQKVTVDDVFFAAQYIWGFSREQICDKHRVGPKSFARHSIRWYLIKMMGFTTQEAAYTTGRANHATMINSVKIVNNLVEIRLKPFSENFESFKNILQSIEHCDDYIAGTLHDYKVLKIQRNKNMIFLKDNQITVVNNQRITKHQFDQKKSVEEFISVILSIT